MCACVQNCVSTLMNIQIITICWLLSKMNNAMSFRVQLCLQVADSISFWHIPNRGITGSCASSIFNFSRNLQVIFYKDCTSLHSRQQHTQILLTPYPDNDVGQTRLDTEELVGSRFIGCSRSRGGLSPKSIFPSESQVQKFLKLYTQCVGVGVET